MTAAKLTRKEREALALLDQARREYPTEEYQGTLTKSSTQADGWPALINVRTGFSLARKHRVKLMPVGADEGIDILLLPQFTHGWIEREGHEGRCLWIEGHGWSDDLLHLLWGRGGLVALEETWAQTRPIVRCSEHWSTNGWGCDDEGEPHRHRYEHPTGDPFTIVTDLTAGTKTIAGARVIDPAGDAP